jgi:hypothetical protein
MLRPIAATWSAALEGIVISIEAGDLLVRQLG